MAQVLTRRLPEIREIVRIREVPLNYNGNESTFLLCCGATPCRIIVETSVRGRELGMWCEAEKGWDLEGASMVVTKSGRKPTVHAPGKWDEVPIDPMVRQVEWKRKVGEKG